MDRRVEVFLAYVDCGLQAFGGRWSHLHAFGGIRGSSLTSLWWHTWTVDCKPLVAYVVLVAYMDRHVEAFGGIRGLSIASLWWLTWIAVHKPLVADEVVCKPLGAYVDTHV